MVSPPLALLALALLASACAFQRPPRPTPPAPGVEGAVSALLTAERIEVEIDWLPGARPSAATTRGIHDLLATHVAPPGGVTVVLDEEIAQGKAGPAFVAGAPLSEAEWWALERAHRRPARVAAPSLYLLFVPRFAPDEPRFRRGVAYPARGFAVVARDAARDAARLTLHPEDVERFVTQHEVGHLLGLVEADDHEHLGHCTDPRCLMYAGPDLRALWAHAWRLFTGRLPDTLDPGCQRELAERRARLRAESP